MYLTDLLLFVGGYYDSDNLVLIIVSWPIYELFHLIMLYCSMYSLWSNKQIVIVSHFYVFLGKLRLHVNEIFHKQCYITRVWQ